MKRIAGLIIIATLFIIGTGEAKHRQEYSGNTGAFTSSLAPYGEWVETDFGSAWRPLGVGHQWRPYLNGRWAWTDYGWYWVSDEPFGWATFHYGRWTYDDYYGWIWIPGRDWGPAWVEWRYDDDYIGWAPLSPYAQFSLNVGIVWSNHWVAPVHYWNFLSCRRFTTARVSDYIEPVERTRRIFGSTRGVGGIRSEHDRVINEGIDNRFIERRANVRIPRVDVVDRKEARTERFIRDDRRARIETYRPNIQDLPRNDRTDAQGDRRNDGRNGRNERPAVVPRRGEAERVAPRINGGTDMNERGRDQVQSQKDAYYGRREQTRKTREEEQARRQELRMQNQQPLRGQDRQLQEQQRSGSQERRVEQQQQRSGNQERRVEQQQQRSGNQERRVEQQQQRSGNQERRVQQQPRSQDRPRIERGAQQGEQRSRGRRPG